MQASCSQIDYPMFRCILSAILLVLSDINWLLVRIFQALGKSICVITNNLWILERKLCPI